MRIPPANDPGWRGFNEHHERFMNEHADFEEDIMEEFLYLAELREKLVDADSDAEATTEHSSTWKFISDWYLIEEENLAVTEHSPFGDIKFTVSWRKPSNHTARTLNFSWQGITTHSHQFLVVLLSSDALLPLAEPFPLGPASADGSRELPAGIVDPTQPCAFRLILSDESAQRAQHASSSELKVIQGSSSITEGREDLRHSQATTARTRRRLAERREDPRGVLIHLRHPTQDYTPVPLIRRAGGVADDFPSEQQLPEDWFPGEEVKLHFSNETGPWQVRRSGTMDELVLQFLDLNEKPLGPPIKVSRTFTEIPVSSPSDLSRIVIWIRHETEGT